MEDIALHWTATWGIYFLIAWLGSFFTFSMSKGKERTLQLPTIIRVMEQTKFGEVERKYIDITFFASLIDALVYGTIVWLSTLAAGIESPFTWWQVANIVLSAAGTGTIDIGGRLFNSGVTDPIETTALHTNGGIGTVNTGKDLPFETDGSADFTA